MPFIDIPIDEELGPILEIGITAATSSRIPGTPVPEVRWVKAVADTGCSHTCIHTVTARGAGLKVVSKSLSWTPGGAVPCNLYLGDIFLRETLYDGSVAEYSFRDRHIVELPFKIPKISGLLGMDMITVGIFEINGPNGRASLRW
jgi:hypothetical protein